MIGGGFHRDAAALVAELDGVVDQVVEHLADARLVRRDEEFLLGGDQLEGDVLAACLAFGGSHGRADLRVDVEIRVGEIGAAGEVVELQHVGGELGQAPGLVQHDGQIPLLHLRRDGAVEDGLQIPLDGGERRAEIVGDVGDELALVLAGLCQAGGHVVQGFREDAELVVTAHVRLIAQVAAGVLVHRGGHLLHGLGDVEQKDQEEDDAGQHEGDGRSHEREADGVVRVLPQRGDRLVDDDVADRPVL